MIIVMIHFNKKLGKIDYFACSGGIDSIAFLYFLSKGNHKPSCVVHFNHHLLPEDDLFEKKVRNFCEELKLKFYVHHCDEKYIDGSVEEWCRKVRYKFLYSLSGNVATGHHLGDAVENYIFNCIRGYPEYLPMPIKTKNIIRPFILTDKESIVSYVEKNKLSSYIEDDPLNNDFTKTRNWIRGVIIPEIKKRYNLNTVVRKIYKKKIDILK
jgi:tRNA(Ile)-lysidine synthase